MNRPTSLYLDLVRFTAAIAVFICHISGQRFTGGVLWQSEPYGDEAVDVFFVLSGFVIAYVASRGETDARSFAIARLARVYSVALPALVATFVLDAAGRSLHPDYYAGWWGYHTPGNGWAVEFFTSLFFVNHLWWLHIGQGSDLPYWSLSYEAWYYAFFGLFLFGGTYRALFVAIAALTAGPNIVALFPLWLLGVWTFRLCANRHIDPRHGIVLLVAAFGTWMAWEITANHYHLRHIGPTKWVQRDQLLQDYIVGSLFAVHLIGFVAVSHSMAPVLERFATPIRWVAGATFTIYLFHVPITQFLTTVVPWPPSAWQTRLLMFPCVLLLLFGIAAVTERQKHAWRAVFTGLFRFARGRVTVG
jgi:peptidoglycan/LPS O-acetylase OafA/YrhL